MNITKQDMKKIRNLVGDITESNLKCVDIYISEKLGIFIPSIGFCEYAIKPNHTHPSYSFVIFFSEKQNIIDVKVEVPSDYCLLTVMSPEICHEEEKSDAFNRYIAIFIDKDFYHQEYSLYNSNNPEKYFWNQYIIKKNILIFIEKFMSEYEENSIGKENILYNLSTIITHELIRSVLNFKTVSDTSIKKSEVQIAINYMNQNFGEKITIETLAKLTNMSESNFNRIFKKETGLSPIEYLINIRIKKAKKFLRARNLTITEISMRCGFYSLSHFSSCFMKQLGMSPSDYENLFNS